MPQMQLSCCWKDTPFDARHDQCSKFNIGFQCSAERSNFTDFETSADDDAEAALPANLQIHRIEGCVLGFSELRPVDKQLRCKQYARINVLSIHLSIHPSIESIVYLSVLCVCVLYLYTYTPIYISAHI